MPALATKTNSRSVDANRIDAGPSKADKQYSLSDFLRSLVALRSPAPDESEAADDRLRNMYRSRCRTHEERAALGVSSGSIGGWLVPEGLSTSILQASAGMSIVRPRAMVIQSGTLDTDLPAFDDTTAQSAGVPPWFGNGMVPSWIPNQGTWPTSETRFRSVKVSAHMLGSTFDVSNTLLASAADNLELVLRQTIALAVAWCEDVAFLAADGIGKPLGILKSPALLTTTARASGSAISYADSRKLSSRLPDSSRDHGFPVWLVSQNALDDLEAAVTETSSLAGRIETYVTNEPDPVSGQVRPKVHRFLSGFELLATTKLPALNTLGDLMLCDLSQYVISDVLSLEIAVSQHPRFQWNQSSFRLVHVVGGLPRLDKPITVEDGTSTVSPFIALAPGT
jgi:HK97 family phage major capsid protein